MKKMCLGLMSIMVLFGSITASASNDIQTGDYVSLGSYNGNRIVWRCVGSDENGRLMLSDKIICYKAFDAAGEHRNGTEKRLSFGSNLWSESNIRCWLNSESEKVDFVCGAAPSKENLWLRNYPYESEPGFLSGFSGEEKAVIKTVSLKTGLNAVDIDLSEGDYYPADIGLNTDVFTKVSKYQTTSDRMFLLDEAQLKIVKENFDGDYYANPDGVLGNVSYYMAESNAGDGYFLRSPNAYEKAADSVCTVNCLGNDIMVTNTIPAYMACGIRPAFYIDDNASFIDGQGTKDNPFIVSTNIINTAATENRDKILLITNEEDGIKIYANGEEIEFTDAKPFIDENNRTQIPIRKFAETIGNDVDYNPESRIVTVGCNGTTVRLKIGERNMSVDGSVIEMDTETKIINDRAYVPLRFVAQELGYTVNYSAPVIDWSVNENGNVILNTEQGSFDDIKDRH